MTEQERRMFAIDLEAVMVIELAAIAHAVGHARKMQPEWMQDYQDQGGEG